MKNDMQKQVEMATRQIIDRLKIWLPGMSTFDFLAATYLLMEAGKRTIMVDNYKELREMLDKKIADVIFNFSKVDVAWNDLKELAFDYNTDVFKEILMTQAPINGYGEVEDIPECIAELFFELSAVNDGDNLANINAKTGRFLTIAAKRFPTVNLTAIEPDTYTTKEVLLRSAAIDNRISVETKKGLFDIAFNSKKTKKFDKIFCTHPFGLRSRMLSNKFEEVQKDCPYIKSGTAADWLYCSAMLKLLEDNGIAAALMSTGCLFTNLDREARKHFLQCGYIKAVISLPARLFSTVGISLALVVFSKGNETVRLIDAREMYQAGRRQNTLSEENLREILLAYENDSDNSIVVGADQFAENDYVLLPERYLFKPEVIKNGKMLEELVTFERGLNLKATQLDKMIADDASETDSFYLRLSDIKDGVIEESLPKLKTVNKELERYRLVDNDIILSRNGAPFKVAIFHYNDDEKVYPVGNMYILRADPVKINPYYLKAFLESEQGGACLKYSLTGIRIQVISLEKLKKMIIPVPPMEEQELVAKRYLAIKDEIEILKIKMKAAKDRLVHVLDSVKAGE